MASGSLRVVIEHRPLRGDLFQRPRWRALQQFVITAIAAPDDDDDRAMIERVAIVIKNGTVGVADFVFDIGTGHASEVVQGNVISVIN